MEDVLQATSLVCDVPAFEVFWLRTSKRGVDARDLAMLCLRDALALPFPDIAKIFGRKSDRACRYTRAACTRARAKLCADAGWRARYFRLQRMLEVGWGHELCNELLDMGA